MHRDLKPANVLINQEGLLKIVDFGVAAAHREGDTQLTKTGYVIGSPKYMAPEQILGKKVDERADIYALGVMLYEMVTGVPPYSRGDHMSVMYQHVQGKARPPQEVNPDSAAGPFRPRREGDGGRQDQALPVHGRAQRGARALPALRGGGPRGPGVARPGLSGGRACERSCITSNFCRRAKVRALRQISADKLLILLPLSGKTAVR